VQRVIRRNSPGPSRFLSGGIFIRSRLICGIVIGGTVIGGIAICGTVISGTVLCARMSTTPKWVSSPRHVT